MRDELWIYINNNGTSQTWLARQTGISRQMLNMYLHKNRNLGKENQEKLRKFLDSKK